MSCRRINIAGRIDAPTKCELRSVIRFFTQKVGLWKTIDAAVSCQTLRQLRRALLTSGVVLIHDSTRPHSAVVTQQLLEQFKRFVSDHPAYSPDLTMRDFHIIL
ncbi:hypothetical protein AVEN_210605-1 [Araneus ventricosus]|uniref:Histone-lysine N-methyltransferase SETMAR n=1 Tax=Araneus ventricosus TaxID=182803 RepID=A0A4Y2HWQ5_ARAVE|nr:hypothetical protein AVEN_210605-1 [Araneus ventricosus]